MPTLKPVVNSSDHYTGNVNATITLVEYGDFLCPYSKHAHELMRQLLTQWSKEIIFVFRHFPLREIHRHAFAAAVAAEAAGRQGKFWKMYDLLFENQTKITNNFILTMAHSIGLDMNQFVQDSKDKRVLTKVENDFESGLLSVVNRTPSFFVNGYPLMSYDESYRSLVSGILEEAESL